MFMTVDEAVAQVNYPRDQILDALQKKKIAGSKTEAGDWLIDAAPFLKKYHNFLKSHEGPILTVVYERREYPNEVVHLQELLELERQRATDLRTERDRWAALVERLAPMAGD